jgi:hypothetical protein
MTEAAGRDAIMAATRRIAGSADHLGTLRHAVIGASAQAELGAAYLSLPDWDDAAVPAFDAFRTEVRAQWDVLASLGLTMTVQDVDPYDGPAALFADVDRGRIAVMSTASTGGHPYLSDADNDLFRAVHDVLGHTATRRGFDRHGEEAAYRAHAACFSPLARRALAVETRGQNGALILSGAFASQRVALLPDRWVTLGAVAPRTSAERDAARAQARTMHAAWGLS